MYLDALPGENSESNTRTRNSKDRNITTVTWVHLGTGGSEYSFLSRVSSGRRNGIHSETGRPVSRTSARQALDLVGYSLLLSIAPPCEVSGFEGSGYNNPEHWRGPDLVLRAMTKVHPARLPVVDVPPVRGRGKINCHGLRGLSKCEVVEYLVVAGAQHFFFHGKLFRDHIQSQPFHKAIHEAPGTADNDGLIQRSL